MATSGSTNFATSRDEIIKYAHYNLGAINEGDTPTSTQVTMAAYHLNLILKAWQADGMELFAMKTTSFVLTAANSYTIGVGGTINVPRPLRIHEAFIRDTSATPDTDVPMTIITAKEYDQINSKSQTGSPSQFFYNPLGAQGSALGTIYIWPLPDTTSIANKQITIRYQRPFEDFDAAADEPDIPQEFYMALVWYLSWSLGATYGIPLDERTRWLVEAEALKMKALESQMEEGSVFFSPSSRRGMR